MTTPQPHQYPPLVVSTRSLHSTHTRAPVRFLGHSRQSSSAHPPRPPCHPPTNSLNTRSGRPRPRRQYPRRVASTQTRMSALAPPVVAPSRSRQIVLMRLMMIEYYCLYTQLDTCHWPTFRHLATGGLLPAVTPPLRSQYCSISMSPRNSPNGREILMRS